MRDVLPVLRLLGLLIMLFSATMLLPLGTSALFEDGMLLVHLRSASFTWLAGGLLWLSARSARDELQPRHGVLLVVLTWSVLPLFATLPLLLGMHALGQPMSFTHAFYEATSGLTTTGGTVMSGVDKLPVSINLWRCFLQWLGGMGILILVVAVLPFLGMGGSQLFRAESPGPMKETKLTPRIAETAKGLWLVYASISTLCALGYWAAGMTPMDAIMHMFTTVSLGGLTPHDASFAYFDSPAIESVAIAVMLLCSANFALYFSAISKQRSDIIWKNPELRITLISLIGGGLLVSFVIWLEGHYEPLKALRYGMFHTVSIATTTGYGTTNFELWPPFAPMFMLLLSSFATSAGSTGGGIKTLRVLVLFQQARHELKRMVHPRLVQPPRIGQNRIPDHIVRAVVAYTVLYVATVLVMTLLMLASELDLVSAFAATLASINCTGLGLAKVGPTSNYAALTDFQIWVCSAGMILGRLELLSFFALLLPSYWKR